MRGDDYGPERMIEDEGKKRGKKRGIERRKRREERLACYRFVL